MRTRWDYMRQDFRGFAHYVSRHSSSSIPHTPDVSTHDCCFLTLRPALHIRISFLYLKYMPYGHTMELALTPFLLYLWFASGHNTLSLFSFSSTSPPLKPFLVFCCLRSQISVYLTELITASPLTSTLI